MLDVQLLLEALIAKDLISFRFPLMESIESKQIILFSYTYSPFTSMGSGSLAALGILEAKY